MSTPATPTKARNRDDGPGQVPEYPTPVEEWMRRAWDRHGNWVLAFCALVALAIAGRGFWGYAGTRHERSVERDYAAATTPEALRAFADLHPGHPLAGAALLTLADQAYEESRFADAAAGYQRAAGALAGDPLEGRARLGLAVCQILSGDAEDGKAGLGRLLDDASQFNAVRAEAGYHLASLAAAAGDGAEVRRLATRLLQIDANSPWTERAFALESELPAPSAAPPAAGRAPAISFPAP